MLADPSMTWPQWWPGLRATDVRPARDGLVGSRADLELRAARWAYALRFDIEVTAASAPHRTVLAVDGDLVGTGRVDLAGVAGGTTVRLDWQVATARGWMNATAPLLAPVFAAAHARAMRAGERGLAEHLTGAGPLRGGAAR